MKLPEYSYIIDTAALRAAVARIADEKVVAMDTEADSMHHYREKVCLIQISIPGQSYIVDPLAFKDLSPLESVLADQSIRKVFHGADYDIRSLHRDFNFEVRSLFDTMVACQFLGEKEIGLAAILKKRFDVELDKKYQKADWSKRPLDPAMIAYAVTDTSLLIALAGQLEDELRKLGRFTWFEEECRLLERVRVGERSQEPLYHRFKGASRMNPRTLAVLEQILTLRENKAQQRDLPPFKILSNDVIRELSERRPADLKGLEAVPGVSPRIVERYGRELLAAVKVAMELPEHRLPRFPRETKPQRDPALEKRVKTLKEWREKKAAQLSMDPGIMANNLLLEALAARLPQNHGDLADLPGVKGWQIEVFADEWLSLLK